MVCVMDVQALTSLKKQRNSIPRLKKVNCSTQATWWPYIVQKSLSLIFLLNHFKIKSSNKVIALVDTLLFSNIV